ncbi:hypothetical protein IFR04_006620 [Cadophora malorum]|uniref:DUF8212 domain-containing protein n=1 Tax=Cadophora malorum TaxID=108018 RepID=A0A8H7TJ92_9HELO|nr:hypothetical protein IFR04_006620 [Cadophora malorum]
MSMCRWFSRGWTLQELIAPKHMQFFDQIWGRRGDKNTLENEIARICGISREVLSGRRGLSTIPIAVRMSWASKRKTTRDEDMAYCLLGIFDINMPMLYGEGEKAFIRLQEEIIKESTDMSIFAWKKFGSEETPAYTGLLAQSPMDFREAGSLRTLENMEDHDIDCSISSRGINLKAPTVFICQTGFLFLPVFHRDQPTPQHLGESSYSNMFLGSVSVGLYLRRVGSGLFVRAMPQVLNTLSEALVSETRPIRIPKTLSADQTAAIDRRVVNVLLSNGPDDYDLTTEAGPAGCWNPSEGKLYAGHTGFFLGYIKFYTPKYIVVSFFLICRFDASRQDPWRFALISNHENKARPSDIEMSYYHYDCELFFTEKTEISSNLQSSYHSFSISIKFRSTGVDVSPESQILEVRLKA